MIELRPYRSSDLAALVANANNPNVSRYLRERFPSPFAEADGRWWIEEGCKLNNNLNYAIIFNDEFVGGIGASYFNDERRHSAEVGYWLGEAHWGKGIMSQALVMLCDEVFKRDDIQRLFSPVVGPNVASMRVLEKCGFEKEGILRKSMMLRGKVYDEYVFGRLK